MKKIIKIVFLLFTVLQSFGQENKIRFSNDSLIYSEDAMNKLKHVVDSLNLKYRTCDLKKAFYSKSQTKANIISLEVGNIKQAKQDIENLISFDEFVKKYPQANITSNILIIREKNKDYKNRDFVEFRQFGLSSNNSLSIWRNDLNLYESDLQNKWLFDYNQKSEYSNESLEAFYFPNKFVSTKIPNKYALMIGYADCLIDTTTLKFKVELEDTSIERYFQWVDVDMPQNWKSLPHESKVKLLDNMRSDRVIGMCSEDDSPKEQAYNIALLAAETYNWSIFLRSHLDIMNDNFERIIDNSLTRENRQTYIHELEELNINVIDLILGISFQIENPAINHYFGNIRRMGKTFAWSKNKDVVENLILDAISDNNLDDYNRLLFLFLFKGYCDYGESDKQKKENLEKLNLAISTLPQNYQAELIKTEK